MPHKTIPLIILIVLAIAFYVYIETHRPKQAPNEQIFCTEEVLLCPQGDYVSRKGPQCAFSPCQGTSFTGILTQDSTGFWLLLDAPKQGTNEVVYKMPIRIKITNALQDIVGKRVQVFGSFETGNTFAVDILAELAGDAGNANLGQVTLGQSVLINGVRVTLNKIVSDSRCPADVQCIQAGYVVANLTLQSNTDKLTTDISSMQSPLSFDSFKVSIANVEPKRLQNLEIKDSEYKITFRVEEL